MNITTRAICQAVFATIFMLSLWSVAQPLPPSPPKVYTAATGVTKGDGAAALSIVPTNPPPKTVIILWSYTNLNNIVFDVYHSSTPHLGGMSIYSSTPQTNFTATVNTNALMEFFGVKARDTVSGLSSDWATR